MPRQYIRKSLRATSYTQEDLQTAVERVRSNDLSNYAASKLYGIPTSTLNDHVKQKSGLLSQTLGRPPAIPIEMENKLASCLRSLEKWGWGLSRTEILDITENFIKENKIQTPFKNDRPGPDWFISFRKRHHLSIKKPQSVEYLRKRMTDPFVIDEYFTLLKETLLELGINEPQRIWNLDETSVCLDPTKTKVVGGIGLPCTRTTKGTGKENVTVLTTVSAAGTKLSPLIVFKGKNMYNEWMCENQKDKYDFEISYAASKRGWIETDIFFNYMDKIVIPGLGDNRPMLIIYDGHTTHVDLKIVALAVENNFTILKLPAHTSHLLQPLDLAVFKSFKTSWDKKLVQWQRQNVGSVLRKREFAKLFAETWHQVSPNVIQSGFRKGGIFPLNVNVIAEEKYDPAALKRWKNRKQLTELKTLKHICIEVLNKNMFGSASAFTDQNVFGRPTDILGQSHSKYKVSFEDLLLQKVAHSQNISNIKTGKLTRVAKGGEVITRTYLQKLKEEEEAYRQKTDMNLVKSSKKEKGIGKKTRTGNESLELSPVQLLAVKKTRKCQKIKSIKTKPCYKKYEIKKQNLKSEKKSLKTTKKISKRGTSVSTTSESGEMSTHSDSDIIDAPSDISELDIVEDTNINASKQKNVVIPSQSSNKISNNKKEKVTILSSVRYKPENVAFYGSLQLKNIDINFDLSKRNKCTQNDLADKENKPTKKPKRLIANKDFGEEIKDKDIKSANKDGEQSVTKIKKEKCNQKEKTESYNVGDTVLTRYYTKCWKYYVGVVEHVNFETKKYTICYYKTIGKKNNVKFVVPKRKDQDCVPENLIVKHVELLQTNENPVELTLINDEDVVYF